jgi:molecular chaperone DnaJ
VASRTHYDVLGVRSTADAATIRTAYRSLAREYHPDRVAHSSAAGSNNMPAINEAYRILSDPGRRAMYDRSLSSGQASTQPLTSAPGPEPETAERWNIGGDMYARPARIPWRSLLLFTSIAIFAIVVLAQFVQPTGPQPPDGILRNGDCVQILDNGDAREIACTGVNDLVVRAFNPTFDASCPGRTVRHRDRLGMGVACVEVPDPASQS